MDHETQVFGQGLNFFHIENLLFSRIPIEEASPNAERVCLVGKAGPQ